MDSPLALFLFLYLGMGAIFVVGLIYAYRQGDVGWKGRRQRGNLLILVGGLAVYMVLHALFQFVLVEV